LFIHFLLLANHEGATWQGLDIEKGQFITGLDKLHASTGISVQTLRTCINRLKSTGEITNKSTNKFRLITIVNWEDYQCDDKKVTSKSTNNLTNNQQTTNKQLTANKNDKNDKNDKKTATNVADTSKKKKNPETPMDLQGFVAWARSSPQHHIQIIADWAEVTTPDLKTYGQWQSYIKRHLRPAQSLTPFTEQQMQKAFDQIQSSSDWLKKPTLETLLKFLT